MQYKLVNPQIKGRISTSFKSQNALGAAKKCWNSLAKCFSLNTPLFAFTLQDGGGKFHHFKVSEAVDNNGNVEFDLSGTKGDNSKLKSNIRSMKQIKLKGGKKFDDDWDDDEWDDDDDDIRENVRGPDLYTRMNLYHMINDSDIWWFWYTPQVYTFSSFFMPTFVSTLTPYIEIHF
jgi:hypothetical protein